MSDSLVPWLEKIAGIAGTWQGPFWVFVLMAIESSLIPFPSEVVMIPAGFWAFRGEFFPGTTGNALMVAFLAGLAGSMAGAYFNYYLALWVGRPFFHKFGKYVLLPPEKLDRAEEIFRKYGEVTTFVCRLLPAIRQLISLPAGLARMNHGRFSLFTALGAGFWIAILLGIGYKLGHSTQAMSYTEVVKNGKALASGNLYWIIPFCVVIVIGYIYIDKKVMKKRTV
jgi:membrane protein DedA with SNARE-associated domain